MMEAMTSGELTDAETARLWNATGDALRAQGGGDAKEG